MDELDIPDEPLFPDLSRNTFLWRDKGGCKHPLHTIDDTYLSNIINFLNRKTPSMDDLSNEYWSAVQVFLMSEQDKRRLV